MYIEHSQANTKVICLFYSNMKRYRTALVSETHYSKPLTHRQKANGETGRYVSYYSADISDMLWCHKHQLHKKLRAEDRTSCLEGLEEIVLEPMHSHKEKRVRNKVALPQPEMAKHELSPVGFLRATLSDSIPTMTEPTQSIVEEKKALQTAKEVPFFWLILPLIVAVLAILVLGLLS